MGLTSVLLAGGKNRRMNGNPKWELTVGRETMLARSVQKLASISKDILVVSATAYTFPTPLLEKHHVKVVYDDTSFLGPLNGLKTAMKYSENDYLFVVAADMPFFSTRLACYMFDKAYTEGYRIVIPEWNNKLQPLHALYSTDLVHAITKDLDEKKYKLVKWIEQEEKVCIIKQHELEEFTQTGQLFFNMNTPEEYQHALTYINEEEGK